MVAANHMEQELDLTPKRVDKPQPEEIARVPAYGGAKRWLPSHFNDGKCNDLVIDFLAQGFDYWQEGFS